MGTDQVPTEYQPVQEGPAQWGPPGGRRGRLEDLGLNRLGRADEGTTRNTVIPER